MILKRVIAYAAAVAIAFPAVVSARILPEVIYDGVGNIEITGSAGSQKIGDFVSIKLTNDAGEIGYIGQTLVKPDGTYRHEFDFVKGISGYKVSVNAAGELINDQILSAEYSPERFKVNLSLAQKLSMAELTASIEDYFGIFTGGTSFTLYLAMYDENERLVSVVYETDKTQNVGTTQKTLSSKIPANAVTCRGFIWDGTKTMIPIAPQKSITLDKTAAFDTLNSAGATWQSVNMRTADMKERGLTGGEGGQRIMSLAISKDDSLLLCGNDTGGINRSTDGGKTWEDCLRGFMAGGSSAIAIDPKNKQRVLATGVTQCEDNSWVTDAPSSITSLMGLYMSEDSGATWKQVLSQPGAVTILDFREAISYDPTSYDEVLDYCKIAYWSRPWRLQAQWTGLLDESAVVSTADDQKGLWKTTDGGEHWQVVNSEMVDGVVKVHPTKGYVYVANNNGFHRSVDGGVTFNTIINDMCYGLDVIDKKGYEDYVWINTANGVYCSSNSGESFSQVSGDTFPQSVDPTTQNKIVRGLKVSPVNPYHMVVGKYNGTAYQSYKYCSVDGGETWYQSVEDASDDFFVSNNREPIFVWSNTTEAKVWSIGGDWITSSNTAGASYKWDYNGGGEVFVDQRTIFNIYNPDIMYYGSQDYHGALTTDGGDTWKHVREIIGAGDAAGYVYGSYAADEDTLIAIVDNRNTNMRTIQVSHDGGDNWVDTGHVVTGAKKWSEICYQSPTDPNVLFAANWRSEDCGETWTQMTSVLSVNTHNPYGAKEIFGSNANKILRSYDSGKTWEKYAEVDKVGTYSSDTEIWDMSYDGINDIMYYVAGNATTGVIFGKIEDGQLVDLTANIKGDETIGKSFQLCAVDPNHPNVVYVGGRGGAYANQYAVQRSTDGGQTFYTLTTNNTDTIVKNGIAGGIDPYDLIVHPETGELWVPQNCNGWVKIAPPY